MSVSRNLSNHILSYILLLCLAACSSRHENSFNGTVRHIARFPVESVLEGEKLPYIQSIGFYGCDLVYPYLLLSLGKQDSLVGIYDVDKKVFLADYFAYGPGPDDFNSFVIVDLHRDSLLCVNDVYRREFRMIRLHQTVQSGRMVYEQRLKHEDIHEQVFYTDSLLWMKSADDNQIRYLCSDTTYPKKRLYKEEIGERDLNHMLLLADAIKPDGSKLVSLAGILDQIDILSLTSADENLSVTTSVRLPTLSQWQDDDYAHVTDFYLGIPRCDDSCIMALHVDPETKRKELHVIDWYGNALAKWQLREDLVDFCVDWDRSQIYGITSEEEVYVYSFQILRAGCLAGKGSEG